MGFTAFSTSYLLHSGHEGAFGSRCRVRNAHVEAPRQKCAACAVRTLRALQTKQQRYLVPRSKQLP